ncbi:unnamed protein product [Amoebophrya sp. A120]|nr:unnamed protein product [Amoebophrya sp. A120]|eukprot:GSA120T00015632001.1
MTTTPAGAAATSKPVAAADSRAAAGTTAVGAAGVANKAASSPTAPVVQPGQQAAVRVGTSAATSSSSNGAAAGTSSSTGAAAQAANNSNGNYPTNSSTTTMQQSAAPAAPRPGAVYLNATSNTKSPDCFVAESANMMKVLDEDYPVESEQGMRVRADIQRNIEKRLNDWLFRISPKDGVERKGKVCTIGSSMLGVINHSSDIDLVCVVPQLPNFGWTEQGGNRLRDYFLSNFGDLLSNLPEVRDFYRIDTAANPTLSLRWNNVDVDILFCDLAVTSVDTKISALLQSPDNIDSDDLLIDLDAPAQRALNGIRVTNFLQKYVTTTSPYEKKNVVPDYETKIHNLKKFRNVLRFIKCWAKRRGIYSNICGYFGGITWAILVAFVCKKYQKLTEAHLVFKFFELYSNWDWDKKPLILRAIPMQPVVSDMSYLHRISKKHSFDQGNFQHMAVVTPAFPCMNTCYNVTESTKEILIKQLTRSFTQCKVIEEMLLKPKEFSEFSEEERKTKTLPSLWREMYQPVPFFLDYSYYLRIEVRHDINKQRFLKLRGFTEANLRKLIAEFDAFREQKNKFIFETALYPYEFQQDCENWQNSTGTLERKKAKYGTSWYFGMNCHVNNRAAASGGGAASGGDMMMKTSSQSMNKNNTTIDKFQSAISTSEPINKPHKSRNQYLDLRQTLYNWIDLVAPAFDKDGYAELGFDVFPMEKIPLKKDRPDILKSNSSTTLVHMFGNNNQVLVGAAAGNNVNGTSGNNNSTTITRKLAGATTALKNALTNNAGVAAAPPANNNKAGVVPAAGFPKQVNTGETSTTANKTNIVPIAPSADMTTTGPAAGSSSNTTTTSATNKTPKNNGAPAKIFVESTVKDKDVVEMNNGAALAVKKAVQLEATPAENLRSAPRGGPAAPTARTVTNGTKSVEELQIEVPGVVPPPSSTVVGTSMTASTTATQTAVPTKSGGAPPGGASTEKMNDEAGGEKQKAGAACSAEVVVEVDVVPKVVEAPAEENKGIKQDQHVDVVGNMGTISTSTADVQDEQVVSADGTTTTSSTAPVTKISQTSLKRSKPTSSDAADSSPGGGSGKKEPAAKRPSEAKEFVEKKVEVLKMPETQ